MLDHLGIGVKDYAAAKRFYEQALAPLGLVLRMDMPTNGGSASGAASCGFGEAGGAPTFWLADELPATGLHLAFRAETREQVDAFHAAALAAGGRDNGGPGIRAHYHPNYYAAFVYDPDGNNLEAVCHAPGRMEDQTENF